jgi:5-methylcytosine-specific restriction endonuclease McrA
MESGCPSVATGRGRCDEHRKALERNRSRARREDARRRNVMYASKRWWALRRKRLLQNPECELQLPGCRRLASEVHHKVAMEDGGAAWDMANLVSTCKPCHSRISRQEQLDHQGEGAGGPLPAA